MIILRTIRDLQARLQIFRNNGNSIGFVPTMGALHEGHLSLLKKSCTENPVSVVSVYVNPTQFNDKKDLERYPRDLEKDCRLIEKTGCDFVFAPNDREMYPEQDTRVFDFDPLDKVMEGKFRPGHFNGVAQIVSKLFDAVMPDRAYFGEKDFQQLAIVRKMTRELQYRTEVVGCPIIREPDGLAMSSRNQLLTSEHRMAAPLIFKTLLEASKMIKNETVESVSQFVVETFESNSLLKLEYFQVVDPDTLQPVKNNYAGKPLRACIAVFAGNIRLIDNMEFIS